MSQRLRPQGNLDLSRSATAVQGGDSGPAFVAGKPDESLLWERVEVDEMPPKKPLAAADKAFLKEWLASGAKYDRDPIDRFEFTTGSRAGYDWWSLQPVRRVEPPASDRPGWDAAIDRFVLARLKDAGLEPSPEVEKRTLIRRVTFDLTGLPPTPEEIDAFLADDAPEAWPKLVDRLLASPHYGERWGRHWLDIVRYGESQGFERDKLRTNAWQYRDWVISALNRDLPYDEFVRLQLAGGRPRPARAARRDRHGLPGARRTTKSARSTEHGHAGRGPAGRAGGHRRRDVAGRSWG